MIINEIKYPYSADYNKKEGGGVEKRRNEIQLLLDSFLKISEVINFSFISDKDETANEIVERYYKIVFQFKPFVKSKLGNSDNKLNIYKVISGLELAICDLKPIVIEVEEEREKLNAKFAFFVGLAFLTGVNKESFLHYSFPNLNTTEEDELTSLIKEHIDWLCMLQGNFHLPYFSNAHTWWALKLLLHELNETRR
jgi:hypothetical protein